MLSIARLQRSAQSSPVISTFPPHPLSFITNISQKGPQLLPGARCPPLPFPGISASILGSSHWARACSVHAPGVNPTLSPLVSLYSYEFKGKNVLLGSGPPPQTMLWLWCGNICSPLGTAKPFPSLFFHWFTKSWFSPLVWGAQGQHLSSSAATRPAADRATSKLSYRSPFPGTCSSASKASLASPARPWQTCSMLLTIQGLAEIAPFVSYSLSSSLRAKESRWCLCHCVLHLFCERSPGSRESVRTPALAA